MKDHIVEQSCVFDITSPLIEAKSKALANWSRNWTKVFNLRLLATPFGQGLRALAFNCDDLRSLWSRSNLHASGRKFFTIGPPNPSHHKWSDVH